MCRLVIQPQYPHGASGIAKEIETHITLIEHFGSRASTELSSARHALLLMADIGTVCNSVVSIHSPPELTLLLCCIQLSKRPIDGELSLEAYLCSSPTGVRKYGIGSGTRAILYMPTLQVRYLITGHTSKGGSNGLGMRRYWPGMTRNL